MCILEIVQNESRLIKVLHSHNSWGLSALLCFRGKCFYHMEIGLDMLKFPSRFD